MIPKLRLVTQAEKVEDRRYFYGYSDSLFSEGEPEPQLSRYFVVRETPKGVWLQHEYWIGEPFWVSTTARKRKAYPTRKEALHGYLCRKRRQVLILTNRLAAAKRRLAAVERIVSVPTEAKGQVSRWAR